MNQTTSYQLRAIQQNEDPSLPMYQHKNCQELLQAYAEFYPQTGFQMPWVGYFILQGNEIVGSCGFVGQPSQGRVEIAYWTFTEFENQGIASFACLTLMSIAHEANNSLVIIAKTAPEHNASTRILAKNGFKQTSLVQDHEIGDAWLWEYTGR